MRILYLHQHFNTLEGTASIRSYEFSRLLRERDHTITILCGRSYRSGLPHTPGKLVDEHTINGVRVLSLNVPYHQKMSYLRRMGAFAAFMVLATLIALRQRKIDVIFATSTPLTIAVPAMIASFINRKPFVFEVRDLWPEVPISLGVLKNKWFIRLARTLEKITYRRAKHIVALSPGMAEGIIQTGIPPAKVTVIPNSSDNGLFDVPPEVGQVFRAQHPEWGSGPLVIYAGAFGAVNNLGYLIGVAECAKRIDEQVSFVLIGTGSETQRLRTLAEARGVLGQNLWIMDPVAHQEMPGVLSAATMAISVFTNNPTMWTNSANKFFDALAAGKPIAINYGGWQADVLQETGAGIILDAENTVQAATYLISSLRDPEWLTNAGHAAKRLAQERFDRRRLAVQLEGVLLAAAEKK